MVMAGLGSSRGAYCKPGGAMGWARNRRGAVSFCGEDRRSIASGAPVGARPMGRGRPAAVFRGVGAAGYLRCRSKQLTRWYPSPTLLQKAAHEVVAGTNVAAKSSSQGGAGHRRRCKKQLTRWYRASTLLQKAAREVMSSTDIAAFCGNAAAGGRKKAGGAGAGGWSGVGLRPWAGWCRRRRACRRGRGCAAGSPGAGIPGLRFCQTSSSGRSRRSWWTGCRSRGRSRRCPPG